MDGDAAPLREIVALKEKYGAWLMVDEAHATGLYGKNGRGLAEELGVGGQIEIQMGTLGKALGASGGYICGSRALIDFLVNRARSFIFSHRARSRRRRRRDRRNSVSPIRQRRERAAIRFGGASGSSIQNSKFKAQNLPAPSFRSLIGDENKAVEFAAKLREQNIFIPAIRYPTVARGKARLRVTLTAAHSRTTFQN